MKNHNILKNKWVKSILLVLGGLFLGWLLFHNAGQNQPKEDATAQEYQHEENTDQIWTCSMHPQIRMEKPGKCPLCGMDLIPMKRSASGVDPNAVQMTDEAIKLASIQTSVIGRQSAVKEVRLYGKIQADERLVKTQAAHVPGRIEELSISFTGETVTKGRVIASIYSPSLVTAQEELLQAKQLKPAQPALVDAARQKLQQWKLTAEQIEAIEQSGKKQTDFEVKANVSGIVLTKSINQGDYVQQGSPLFEVADLSRVWVLFDAYESDLPWIKKGDIVSFNLESMPGQTFSGKVTFIDPVLNPSSRVARVRVEATNKDGKLKPEMFVTGRVTAELSEHQNAMVVPQSAVLWTGTRSVVYVKTPGAEEPEFRMREIETGPALNNQVVVIDGLREGEEIVTNGTFVVDAAAQLAGKPSMMEPGGGAPQTGHDHANINMSGNEQQEGTQEAHEKQQENPQEGPQSTDPVFQDQLTRVYKAYLVMKDAFVGSDAKKVGKAAKEIIPALKATEAGLLKGHPQMVWVGLADKMEKSATLISQQKDIEKQRNELMNFISSLYTSIKAFGVKDVGAYYQYCSMANDYKGAYWISDNKEIRNPYWGDQMLTCGEVKEVISE